MFTDQNQVSWKTFYWPLRGAAPSNFVAQNGQGLLTHMTSGTGVPQQFFDYENNQKLV